MSLVLGVWGRQLGQLWVQQLCNFYGGTQAGGLPANRSYVLLLVTMCCYKASSCRGRNGAPSCARPAVVWFVMSFQARWHDAASSHVIEHNDVMHLSGASPHTKLLLVIVCQYMSLTSAGYACAQPVGHWHVLTSFLGRTKSYGSSYTSEWAGLGFKACGSSQGLCL